SFLCDVGVDDETGAGTIIFQVFADGTKIFDSGVMTQTATTKTFNLNITNVQQLRLHVGDSGDGNSYDHADWAAARMVPAPPQTPTAPAAPSGLAATVVSSTRIDL